MENPNSDLPEITRDCINFKNYLTNQFGVEKFGEFICTYTFPLTEIEALKAAAKKAKKEPVSLRLYYGCEADGTQHKLHISLLDNQGEVIVDSSSIKNTPKPKKTKTLLPNLIASNTDVNKPLMGAALERKCPPGGTADRLINTLFI